MTPYTPERCSPDSQPYASTGITSNTALDRISPSVGRPRGKGNRRCTGVLMNPLDLAWPVVVDTILICQSQK